MYRPENWERIEKDIHNKLIRQERVSKLSLDDAIEAGADAMLEALKKERCQLPDCNFDGYDSLGRKGTLVFIPDEQVKKDD